VGDDEIEAAIGSVSAERAAALELAAVRIEVFHRAQLPVDLAMTDAVGVRMGMRWTALDAVGLYVPGGKAAYPSSVLMNAIPARVAGVGRLAMCVPAARGLDPLVLAAARRGGVSEIYRIGGAQAVAAMAYGTESITAVDRIVGPGNAWVAEAKRQVFGRVGIDSVAGPSDVVVLGDSGADPRALAVDLLAQAEHDEDAKSTLITDDAALADAVAQAALRELPTLSRESIARASWERHGAIVVVRDWAEGCRLVDRLAPEHLQIVTRDPEALFATVRHAGSVFLGHWTPEAVGDYVGGPNHVLPTGRTARFASGLSVYDFLKRTTWLQADQAALAAIGPAAVTLAEAEGLQCHARSVALRLGQRGAG
jgi:histidinol dehydrogenase